MPDMDPLISQVHIEMVGTVILPIALFWLDSRKRAEKRHQEWMSQQQTQHQENSQRLTKIETSLEPIVDWWNSVRGKERNG